MRARAHTHRHTFEMVAFRDAFEPQMFLELQSAFPMVVGVFLPLVGLCVARHARELRLDGVAVLDASSHGGDPLASAGRATAVAAAAATALTPWSKANILVLRLLKA